MPAPSPPAQQDNSQIKQYAVRFISIAIKEAIAASEYVASFTVDETQSSDYARRWYQGLRDLAGTLATLPHRFAVEVRESRRFGMEVRRLLYRMRMGGVAYHAYYRILEESADGAKVQIIHVRHASRRPMTFTEARDIIAGIDAE